MNVLKYLGIVLLLIGVGVLVVPFLSNSSSNSLLGIGLLLIIVGFFGHILLNRRIQS
ncbi:MAG: hypothetical protein LBR50_07975 [Tannerella sp.]|jgi:uncharacterized membrane protein HdeD (DUF308 family)|nr:hypothetical protein [Tannerella sp.]